MANKWYAENIAIVKSVSPRRPASSDFVSCCHAVKLTYGVTMGSWLWLQWYTVIKPGSWELRPWEHKSAAWTAAVHYCGELTCTCWLSCTHRHTHTHKTAAAGQISYNSFIQVSYTAVHCTRDAFTHRYRTPCSLLIPHIKIDIYRYLPQYTVASVKYLFIKLLMCQPQGWRGGCLGVIVCERERERNTHTQT